MPSFVHSTEDQLGFALREIYRDATGARAAAIADWFTARSDDDIGRWFDSPTPAQIRGRMNTTISRRNSLNARTGE